MAYSYEVFLAINVNSITLVICFYIIYFKIVKRHWAKRKWRYINVYYYYYYIIISCLGILHICNLWILLRKIVIYLVGRKFYLRGRFFGKPRKTVIFENRFNRCCIRWKTDTNGQKSVFKWRVRDYFAFESELLIQFITKDEKNQVLVFTHGKTEEILFKFVNVFETLCVRCQVWSAMLKWRLRFNTIKSFLVSFHIALLQKMLRIYE